MVLGNGSQVGQRGCRALGCGSTLGCDFHGSLCTVPCSPSNHYLQGHDISQYISHFCNMIRGHSLLLLTQFVFAHRGCVGSQESRGRRASGGTW